MLLHFLLLNFGETCTFQKCKDNFFTWISLFQLIQQLSIPQFQMTTSGSMVSPRAAVSVPAVFSMFQPCVPTLLIPLCFYFNFSSNFIF